MKRANRTRGASTTNVTQRHSAAGLKKKMGGKKESSMSVLQRKATDMVNPIRKTIVSPRPVPRMNADFASQHSNSLVESAEGMNDQDVNDVVGQQISVTAADQIEHIGAGVVPSQPQSVLNTTMKHTRSGKVVFGETDQMQYGTQSQFSDESRQQQHDRRLLKELLDSDLIQGSKFLSGLAEIDKCKLDRHHDFCFSKDPLEEMRELANRSEMLEVNDLMDAISCHQANCAREKQQSEIKRSLARISDTELKLGDIISRHIKKHGSDNFGSSQYIVTDQLSTKNNNKPTCSFELPNKDVKNQTTTLQPAEDSQLEESQKYAYRRPSSQVAVHNKTSKVPQGGRVLKPRASNTSGSTPTTKAIKLNAGVMPSSKKRPKSKSSIVSVTKVPPMQGKMAKRISVVNNMQREVQKIIDSATEAKIDRPLQHFKPGEIFNINTHALFRKTKEKDPDDSDAESQDDEDEINRLLCSKDGRSTQKFGPEEREKRSAKIDLSAYDPNKSIEYNKKVVFNMINQAKQATNTDKASSMEYGRREQLKVVKFFKKDQSNIKQSKIAQETAEAIKYLNKRQPLTVQNTQAVDDEILFSIPGRKPKRGRQEKTAVEQWAMRSESNNSPNTLPQQSMLQLQHASERAKFFRNVQTLKGQGADTLAPGSQDIDTLGEQVGQQQINKFQTRRRTVGGSNPALSGVNQHGPQSALLMSRSSSRSKFQINPSTYSKQIGRETVHVRPQSHQKISSVGHQTAAMHIDSGDGRSIADSPSLACFAPNIIVNKPTVINNILFQQPFSHQFKRNKKSSQSVKRFGNSASNQRNISRQLGRKTTHVEMTASRISDKEGMPFATRIKSGQQRNANKSGADLSAFNFYPTKQAMGRNISPHYTSSRIPTQPSTRIQHTHTGNENRTTQEGGASSTNDQQSTRFYRHTRGKSIQEAHTGFTVNDMAGNMARINESLEQRSLQQELDDQTTQGQFRSGAVTFTNDIPYHNMQAQQEDYFGEYLGQTSHKLLDRKKSSAIVKIDREVLQKQPSLSLVEILRILDARNTDMCLKKVAFDNTSTVARLESLMHELTDGNGQGPAQRFRDYCEQYSINRRLVLQKYSLGPAAAQEIAYILARNQEIAHIDLTKNNLGDVGAEIIARVVQNNTSVIHLDLSQNNITPRGAKKVFKALKNNISLISLKIGNTENVNRNRLNPRAVSKLIQMLQISQVLQFLDLRSTNLTDTGLAVLAEGLPLCPTLFVLNIAKNDITQSGIEKFAPILFRTKISELDLSLNPLGNGGIRCFADNLWEKVPVQTFTPSSITTDTISHREPKPVVYTHGSAKCGLTKLNLSETKIQEAGAYQLFRMLTDYFSLQHLILDYNQFIVSKMSTFQHFISKTRIRTLSLNHCNIGDDGGVTLAEAVSNSKSMRDLQAQHCSFGDATARSFANCIEENASIERLDISNNNINDAGGELLAIAIIRNENLRYLNLKKNNMRAISGAMFAKSMIENKTLKCLKLENNYINISFMEDVAKLIQRNNLQLLETNVEQLHQDRKGFLDTRLAKWNRVERTKEKLSAKLIKLKKKVFENTHTKANLSQVLTDEFVDLKTNIKFIKGQAQYNKDRLLGFASEMKKKDEETLQAETDAEKAIESQQQMVEDNDEWISLAKENLKELQEEYFDVKFKLTQEAEDAEKLMRTACEENQHLRDQIETLKEEAQHMKLL